MSKKNNEKIIMIIIGAVAAVLIITGIVLSCITVKVPVTIKGNGISSSDDTIIVEMSLLTNLITNGFRHVL